MTRTTTTTTATLAVAADYADALMTARRAKNWLFLLLALILIIQIAVFFCVKFNVLHLNDTVAAEHRRRVPRTRRSRRPSARGRPTTRALARSCGT